MIVVSAVINIKKGKEKEFEKEFLKLRKQVLKDPGCFCYSMHRSADDPGKFLFYEQYENDEAVKYHTSTEHFKSFFKRMDPLMKGKPEVSFYELVE